MMLHGFFHGDAMADFMNGAPFIQIQAGPGSAPAGGFQGLLVVQASTGLPEYLARPPWQAWGIVPR